ncbi:MAG TPA: tRNA (N(6)-L-threonylcarbamoyladenosine(37)-C(2))-methylthiotransferase MtaB [Nitrolancea sp.]|nr:tRNA (N(6)-L-threonylcarbamoyladenosine(37)-C(2))-methylthiotransferase MtaB [Nitrolancea sp.]
MTAPRAPRHAPRFAICTLGCKLNQADEDEVRRGLRQAGLVEVAFDDPADIYIVNTCTVTHLADRRSRQMLRRARRQAPESLVAAIGCYPAVSPEELQAMPEVDLVVGSVEKLTVVDDILTRLEWHNAAFDLDPEPSLFSTRTRRMLKIQEGCRAHCTYCVIPTARGKPRNIAPEQIVAQVREAEREGYREVVLTGTHVGTYKWPVPGSLQPLRLADLLEQVLDQTGIERLRVTSVGPHEIDAQFISILQRPRMMPHLHLALQSGSATVLHRMKRWYNLQQFRRAVNQLRAAMPEIGITTDVIVGFPGESDEEFEESCDFVREMAFAKVHVFPFSARRGTPAAGMPEQVPSRVKEARGARLRALAGEMHAAFVAQQLGREAAVLLEHEAGELQGRALWSGLSGNYLRVYVPAEPGADVENRIVTVRLRAPYQDGALADAPPAIG